MRILIIHNILWSHYKSSVFQALQQLVDGQPDTDLMVLQIARNERSRASLESMDNTAIPAYRYTYKLLFDRFLEDVRFPELTKALLREAKAYRPDVINLTGYYDLAQLVILLWAKTQGIRVVMQNESTTADHTRVGWKEQLKRWLIGLYDGFFCFGNQSANYLIQLGVPPDRILLRKSAVDNDALRSIYEKALPTRTANQKALHLPPNNFVFAGRLVAAKNLPMLLTCFADALNRFKPSAAWGLLLLGDGDERPALEQQISDLNLTDSVTILPGRAWFQVPELLALSTVLVLPSRSEAWGLVVNEAMVCGLPVIVSNRCGCVHDLVRQGENGFIFDPDQPDELTYNLVQFMDNRVDIQQMGQAGRSIIQPYSPAAVAQEMLDSFRKIAK